MGILKGIKCETAGFVNDAADNRVAIGQLEGEMTDASGTPAGDDANEGDAPESPSDAVEAQTLV